jgi:thiamine-phosphate diphosphorylase / hydroxyethylthiazole kinase
VQQRGALTTWGLGPCLPQIRKPKPGVRPLLSYVLLVIDSVAINNRKTDSKSIIGTAGVKKVLGALSAMDEKVSAVAVGGINASNVQRIMYQSKASFKALDGIAVVSSIIAAPDAKRAAEELKELIRKPPAFATANGLKGKKPIDRETLIQSVSSIVKKLGQARPLCHNMTNLVVQNFAANVALAMYVYPALFSNRQL